MSLIFKQRGLGDSPTELVPPRPVSSGSVTVGPESALKSSAVWACLRLRADLISTMPVDVFRRVGGVQVEVPKPAVLVTPGGEKVHVTEWLWATQFDLDRCGNAFGIVTERSSSGLPSRIDLQPFSEVTVRARGSEVIAYRIGSKTYEPRDVWHERQFTAPGAPVGLSPVACAAMSIGGYLSAQQFALDWFANSAGPGGQLRNNAVDSMDAEVADVVKRRFKASIQGRDVFVSGREWEYIPGQADASATAFLEQMKYGITDVCRFFGVPADMIDAEGSSSSITYANVTQRNLQLLVMNLGPAIIRREAALSSLLPQPRYVKFNTDALLRMDPAARTQNILAQVGLTLAPSEARELDNRPPFTPEQLDEIATIKRTATAPTVTKSTPEGM